MAFLFVGLVAALGLAETLLRIFGHEGPVYTIRDPVIGRRYTRSWEGDCYIEEADRVVHLRFNREGMRDRDYPEVAPDGTVRIAVLGDSMVAALGVPEEQTFVRRLETRLQGAEDAQAKEQGRAARRFEVMNWGVQGSSPALQSVLVRERVVRYAPRWAVFVFFTGNDFSDDWQPIGGRRQGWGEVRLGEGVIEHEPFGGSEFSFNEWLARNSRLYVWQKRMLSRLGEDGGSDLRPGLRIFDRSPDPELDRAWEFQRDVQQALMNLTRNAGIDVAARVVLPSADEVYDDLWSTAVERGKARGWKLEPTFRDWHVDASDRVGEVALGSPRSHEPIRPLGWDGVWGAMKGDVAGRPSTDPAAQLFLRGTGHLNERGHELVARTLADRLAARFLE